MTTAVIPSPPPPPAPLPAFGLLRLTATAAIDAGAGVYVGAYELPGHLWAVVVDLPAPGQPADPWVYETWMLADPVSTKAQAETRLRVLRDDTQDWRSLRRTLLKPVSP